jgi:hypothetical protein
VTGLNGAFATGFNANLHSCRLRCQHGLTAKCQEIVEHRTPCACSCSGPRMQSYHRCDCQCLQGSALHQMPADAAIVSKQRPFFRIMSILCRISHLRQAALSVPVSLVTADVDRAPRSTVACAQGDTAEGLTASIANGKLKLQVENVSLSNGAGLIVRPTVEHVLNWYMQPERGTVTLLSMPA